MMNISWQPSLFIQHIVALTVLLENKLLKHVIFVIIFYFIFNFLYISIIIS